MIALGEYSRKISDLYPISASFGYFSLKALISYPYGLCLSMMAYNNSIHVKYSKGMLYARPWLIIASLFDLANYFPLPMISRFRCCNRILMGLVHQVSIWLMTPIFIQLKPRAFSRYSS